MWLKLILDAYIVFRVMNKCNESHDLLMNGLKLMIFGKKREKNLLMMGDLNFTSEHTYSVSRSFEN